MYFDFNHLARHMEKQEETYEGVFEQKLTAEMRKALPDDAFGLPKKRKYPLVVKDVDGSDDWTHLRDAIAYFHTCKSEEDKKELAQNIAKVIKQYKLDIDIRPTNKIRKYANFD